MSSIVLLLESNICCSLPKFSFDRFSLKTDCSPHPYIHFYYLTYSLKGNDKVDIKLLNFSGKSGLQNGRAS